MVYATYATRGAQNPRIKQLIWYSESTHQILEHTIEEDLILASEETRFSRQGSRGVGFSSQI